MPSRYVVFACRQEYIENEFMSRMLPALYSVIPHECRGSSTLASARACALFVPCAGSPELLFDMSVGAKSCRNCVHPRPIDARVRFVATKTSLVPHGAVGALRFHVRLPKCFVLFDTLQLRNFYWTIIVVIRNRVKQYVWGCPSYSPVLMLWQRKTKTYPSLGNRLRWTTMGTRSTRWCWPCSCATMSCASPSRPSSTSTATSSPRCVFVCVCVRLALCVCVCVRACVRVCAC